MTLEALRNSSAGYALQVVTDNVLYAAQTAAKYTAHIVKEISGVNGVTKAINAWKEISTAIGSQMPASSMFFSTVRSIQTFTTGFYLFGRVHAMNTGEAFKSVDSRTKQIAFNAIKTISNVALLLSDAFLLTDLLEDWNVLPKDSLAGVRLPLGKYSVNAGALRGPADWIGWGAAIMDVAKDFRQIYQDGLGSKNYERFETVGSAAQKLVTVIARSNITSYSPQLRLIAAVSSAFFFLSKTIRSYGKDE